MKIKRCRLAGYVQKKLVEMFVGQVTARTAADLVGVNYHTAHLFYHKLRDIITAHIEEEWPFDGEVEMDESYFGGVRKGKLGRGAGGKVAVFGLLKRGGHVFACMIPDASSKTLLPIIRRKVQPDSIVYTDCWKGYNVLDVSEFHHKRVNHSQVYVDGRNHINGIENFWNQAKRILRKYNGIPRKHFHLFLKECEFRFNYGTPKQQLNTLLHWCKLQSTKEKTNCVIYTSPLTNMGKKLYRESIDRFLSDARHAVTLSNVRIRGTRYLSAATRKEIQSAVASFPTKAGEAPVERGIMAGLLERFEEICRRQAIEVPASMRRYLLKQMLAELKLNQHTLGRRSLQSLVPVTAFHGAIVPKLHEEFADFLPWPFIFGRAVTAYPVNPRGYLRKLRQDITGISAEVEFAAFHGTPGIIRRVAAMTPSDPRAYLRKILRTARKLSTEEEFTSFRDTPGIFRLAALGHPIDPRSYLRKVARTIAALAQNKEFAAFLDTPGLFRTAAVSHPGDPVGYLRKVARTAKELSEEKEFAVFRDMPGIFRQAAVGNPANPRAYLRKVIQTVNELRQEREFAAFHDAPGLLRRAAMHNPTDPRAWLRSEPKSSWQKLRWGKKRMRNHQHASSPAART